MLALVAASLTLGGVAESAAAAKCEVTVMVDRHMLRPAMDASLRPTLSWILSPGCGPAPQTGFSTALWDPSGKQIWRSVQVHTNRSDSIPFVGEGSLSLNPDGCAEPPSPLALAAAALPLCSLHAAAQKGTIQPPLPPCRCRLAASLPARLPPHACRRCRRAAG